MKDKKCTCKLRHSLTWIIMGIVILANVYWPLVGWWTLIGWLLVIFGLLKLIMPSCDCSN